MQEQEVKPTPSALKWLAEKRARIAHRHIEAQRLLETAQTRADAIRQDLAALDRALAVYDASLNPTKIAPVNGWQGTYGRRGALTEAVARLLQEQAPNWVPTAHLEQQIIAEFGLTFDLPVLRGRWRRKSLLSALRAYVLQGKAERDLSTAPGAPTRWRWKHPRQLTLADLRRAAAGGETNK